MNAEPVICAALLHDAAGDRAGDLAPGGWHLMNAAYYEDLAGRLYGLVIRLSDRLPADQVRWLHHVTEVGSTAWPWRIWPRCSPAARSPSLTKNAAT